MLDFGFYNLDCMDGMKEFPDKYFELAIVDPPYGGGNQTLGREINGQGLAGGSINTISKVNHATGGRFARYEKQGGIFDNPDIAVERTWGTWASKYGKKCSHWDIAPTQEYFNELFRVSKNQIIWGGNYFDLPPTRCFVVWRKLTISENFSMAMCEYAWCSFNQNAKWIEIAPQDSNRFHPTQKPVKLYEWLLINYAKKGDKILDTHVGSASSLIACYNLGFDYVGFEIDKDYYEAASQRLEDVMSQVRFDFVEE